MSEEYNPIAARLTVEEMKNIIGEEVIPIKGFDNGAKMFTTETLAKVNRVFVVAALLDVEDKGDSNPFYVGRLADPTGSIQINAGQYQPEASAALAEIEDMALVSVIGKLAPYTSAEGKTFVSLRAEKVHLVDSATQNHYLAELKKGLGERLQNPGLPAEIAEKYNKIMAKL